MPTLSSPPKPTSSIRYPLRARDSTAAMVFQEGPPAGPPPPRLLDRVRAALRARHYSLRTEEAYVAWIRRYILFHNKRHPVEMGAREVTKFLTALATDADVAASTQNQALSALLFLYRDVLDLNLPWLDGTCERRVPSACQSSSRATRCAAWWLAWKGRLA